MRIASLPTASSGKSAKGAAEFSSDLASELRSSFGQEAILSSRDPRLVRLHQGWQDANIQQTLGPAWQDAGDNTWTLDNGGDTRQVLSLAEKETRLATIKYVSITRTLGETLILSADGKVRQESSTAR